MRKWKSILLLSFLLIACNSFSQGYNFRNFSSEEGLAQPYVYSVIQDIHGYLWIGTANGLSKYNGLKFENYSISDSLADNFITCSTIDGESLWFGHMNGRITYYNGKKFIPVKKTQQTSSYITHFAKSQEGLVWASTYSDGLLRLDKDTGFVDHYVFKDQVSIITFEFTDSNKLFVGTNTGLLLCRLNGSGEIETVRHFNEIPGSKITAIQKMKNSRGYYIGTENDGVFKLINEGNLFRVSKIISDPDFDFSGIQDIYEDSNAGLWLCSFGNGLIKLTFSASGFHTGTLFFNNTNGFASSNIKTVYEDHEGSLWSGTYGEGLIQITPKTFSVLKVDKQFYGNDIFSIWFNPQFRWIGTENGLVKMDQVTGKIVKFYSKGSGLPKDTVTAIYSTNGKVLWIGTEKNGLFKMEVESEKILKYPVVNGTLENSINVIAGKGNLIWVGTKKGLFGINSETDAIVSYSLGKGGLPHNYINCIYIDKTGKLWVTTRSNILSCIANEKVENIPLNSNTSIFTLGPVTEDSDSRIWVGSYGNGVFMIKPDSVINLTVKEGLLSNYCYSLICDGNNSIWIGHRGGLSRIKTDVFMVKPVEHIVNVTDRYQFNPNAATRDEQKRIWFGSDRGLVSYDPSMEHQSLTPPVLGITSLRINDVEKDFTDRIILSPGNYKIRIDFIGISLKEPTLVTYQYKMDGYDQWSEIVKNTSITYTNLRDGKYTFMVNASSGDGAVSETPLSLIIIIKRSLWKSWWFYVILVSLSMVLIFIYIKRREYLFLAEKRILEEKVIERTFEIQTQKNEIEMQRDLIDEKNASITSSIRYASNIQNAILPPAELVERLFPDSFILSKPKDIVSGDFYWLAERGKKIIFTVADCTGHGVPGAFMSFLGISLLNSIVNIQGNTKSDIIVTNLRERVIRSLQQGRKDVHTTDGMDIALCVLDQKEQRIQYSGGMNNLVFIRNSKLEIIKADRFSVCVTKDDPGPFTLNEMDIEKGDVFYLFTDGYKDQFGGDFDKKYLVPHFYLTLLEIHKLPMPDQKNILEKKLSEWMKGGIQTDDITVLGIRF